MKLMTKYLGAVEVDPAKILQFPGALPGFPDEKEFIILDLPNNSVFQLLQSTKTEELAFVITNPYFFYKDYEIKLEDDLLNNLQIKEQEDVAVYAIVTLNEPFKNSTMNLQAPLIINANKFIGKQYILNDHRYSSKTPLQPVEKEAE